MKTEFATSLVALAAGLFAAGCSDDRSPRIAGTDEHGNAMSARIHVVTDSDGLAAGGVEVVVRPGGWLEGEPLDSLGESPSALRLRTDSQGFCTIRLHDNSARTIRAGDGEFASSASVRLESDAAITLVLRPTGSIQGVVDGAPEGTPVRVPGLSGTAWTDASGRFSLGSLPAGPTRLQIGSGGMRRVFQSVGVSSKIALDLGRIAIVADDTAARVAPSGTTAILPATPTFAPRPGTFTGAQEIRISGENGDAVETSSDGIRWTPLNGSLRLMASSCIFARAVRDGHVLSNTTKSCYSIEP